MIPSAADLPTEIGADHAHIFVDGRTRYSLRKSGDNEWTLYGHFRPARPTLISSISREGDRWVARDRYGLRAIRKADFREIVEGCLT
ncbi:hypothetical protein [Microcella frigidaquae]|uniref:Uncharacterized protein n=1 Tax=Microcella frigidaquae TaxID=424758 RepID=A0A840XK33_9MICO|nr:hypothetical protein [Microcella frigidaquae]MBB5617217.1 hypothetical protein [Microcella frigidaquae]NHN45082.1 hypothetical protein [Microcella frigidaquae]